MANGIALAFETIGRAFYNDLLEIQKAAMEELRDNQKNKVDFNTWICKLSAKFCGKDDYNDHEEYRNKKR